ncbi:MAG: hypothetical protein RIG62_16990 [Cyclobacteriaceae bacterium]
MKDRKYYVFLAGALALLVLVEYLSPEPTDWTFTLHHRDKIPYGTYVLGDLIQELFPDQQVRTSYETFYEIAQAQDFSPNVLLVASEFAPDSLDADALFTAVAQGQQAFVSANYFYNEFADTLHLGTAQAPYPSPADSLILEEMMAEYCVFTSYDTSRTTVLQRNKAGKPILLQVPWGEGQLFLHSEPRLFTNYELLQEERYQEAATLLSFLPVQDVLWTEYYQIGKLESGSPLRFFMSQPPLRWGLYVGLMGLLLFVLFEAKRKQRVIPIHQPPTNTTLEFVSTVGNLYYRTRNHKNLADKKIAHFYRFVRERYRLHADPANENFREELTHKADKKRIEVDQVLDQVIRIQQATRVKDEELLTLNQRVDAFYQTAR